jgi:fibro-slime domain-containing protein
MRQVLLPFGQCECSAPILTLLVMLVGCGHKDAGVEGVGAGGATATSHTGGSISNPTTQAFVVNSSGGSASQVDAGTGGTVLKETPWPPSADYTNVTNVTFGAYALGPDISSGTIPPNESKTCSGLLYGVARDFMMGSQTGGHPDFETAPDSTSQSGVKGIVQATLGSDGKPVYANPTDPLTGIQSADTFSQWYNDSPGVNMSYIVALKLASNNGISTFSASINNGAGLANSAFFPLDGAGFGNEGQNHNFSFTTEFHTSFKYQGGETFMFVGDDDVWVFINNQLVIDLGGRHGQLTGSVSVDTLGLTVGQNYDLAVFQAERHTTQSNFRIDTSLEFVNCGQIGGVIVG